MTSYFVAGKADDPGFARVEYISKLIKEEYPNLSFHMEMKHPDDWKAFVTSIFRRYDFQGYNEEFPGPLIWTSEGHLVGNALDFVQKIYTEKLGLKAAPEVTNPMFRNIAKDNLAEVKAQKHRARVGVPFEEKCATAFQAGKKNGFIQPPTFDTVTSSHTDGVRVELRTSKALSARIKAPGSEGETGEAEASSNDQGSDLPAPLLVAEVGQEHSHRLILAPNPLGPRHMLMVPRRFSRMTKQSSENVEVLSRFAGGEEDLGLDDFHAAAEVLLQKKDRSVAFWLGTSKLTLGQPVDTHLQVLPDGFESEDLNGLPYPSKLQMTRVLKEGMASVPMLEGASIFHALEIPPGDPDLANPSELAQSLNVAYETARARPGIKELTSTPGSGVMVAFAYNWLVLVPLRAPKQGSGFEEAAYAQMPPPPACALLGVVICPSVEKQWPETAWGDSVLPDASGGKSERALVESRAEVLCIPEETAEYKKAEKEVMVRWNVLEKDPLAPLKLWGVRSAAEE